MNANLSGKRFNFRNKNYRNCFHLYIAPALMSSYGLNESSWKLKVNFVNDWYLLISIESFYDSIEKYSITKIIRIFYSRMNFDRYCLWADLPDWLGTISSSGRIGIAGLFHIFLFTDWYKLVMTRVARLHRSYKTPESWENVTRSLIQRPRSFNHKVYLGNVGVYQSKMPICIKGNSLI